MIEYRLATRDDNKQLIALTAAGGMMGETPLRIDRKPDFFKLLEMRGDTKVFVAVDNNVIVGCICVSLQEVYVNGQIYPLQYIGDFKVAEAYRNKGIGLQLCNEMADYVISIDADLAFLNVSKGNTKPLSFFRDRPNIPDFENIGLFNIYQFIGKKNGSSSRQQIEAVNVSDELINFLNSHYSKYELGSVITKEKLEGTNNFIIKNGNEIVAAISIIDTMPVKQNVVTRISWKMKWLLKFLNSIGKITGMSKMPLINEPVRMMYIKYMAVKNGERQLVKLLVNHARSIAYEKGYSFVSIGVHDKDRFNECFKGLFKLTFKSVGMLLTIKNNQSLIKKVKSGVPYEDYSLV